MIVELEEWIAESKKNQKSTNIKLIYDKTANRPSGVNGGILLEDFKVIAGKIMFGYEDELRKIKADLEEAYAPAKGNKGKIGQVDIDRVFELGVKLGEVMAKEEGAKRMYDDVLTFIIKNPNALYDELDKE